MTHAVIDPALLALPDDFFAWVESFGRWQTILTGSPLSASCPAECRQEAYQLWSDHAIVTRALTTQACLLDARDVLRVFDAVLGRVQSAPLPDGHEVVLGATTCTPSYCPPNASPQKIAAVLEHLGEVAVRRQYMQEPVGIITEDSSWSHPSADVIVDSNILLRQMSPDGPEEPTPDDATVRELLHAWRRPADVMKILAHEPCGLLAHIEFGVRVYAVAVMGEKDCDPQLTFGPRFADSVKQMNYFHDKRRAKALLRTLAIIASGRAAEVPGHRERRTSAPSSPVVTDVNGDEVERSYLARKSPNAHRMFWVRKPVPHILNVGGHDSKPAL